MLANSTGEAQEPETGQRVTISNMIMIRNMGRREEKKASKAQGERFMGPKGGNTKSKSAS